MLTLEELEKIRPGDIISFNDCYYDLTTEKVKEVACRCGFDKDGHLVEGYDDYVITENDTEVGYDEIINIENKESAAVLNLYSKSISYCKLKAANDVDYDHNHFALDVPQVIDDKIIIQKALTRKQKLEKVIEIIKDKRVHLFIAKELLTEEEFKLLKEVFGNGTK